MNWLTLIVNLITPLINAFKSDNDKNLSESDKRKLKLIRIIVVTLFTGIVIAASIFGIKAIIDFINPPPQPTPPPIVIIISPGPTPESTPTSSPVPTQTPLTPSPEPTEMPVSSLVPLISPVPRRADDPFIIANPKDILDSLIESYTDEQYLEAAKLYDEGKGGIEQDDKKAFDNYVIAANKGNIEAMVKVGEYFWSGKVIDQDYEQAFLWWKKAADEGSADGMYHVGFAYANGIYMEQNYVFARKWFEDAGEGHAKALDWLGYLHQKGFGVPQSDEKAFEYYLKSADLGCDHAMNQVGIAYENGRGCQKDITKAIEWYTKADAENYTPAMYNLGYGYYNGLLTESGEPDMEAAFKWYQKAAENGHAGAKNNLALMYYNGVFVDQDLEKAAVLWQEAADQGNVTAMDNLAIILRYGKGVPRSIDKALIWYERAANAGNIKSMIGLADIFYYDTDHIDHNNAFEWYLRAAEKDDAHSEYMTGYMLLYGQGTTADPAKATEWLEKAAEQDDPDAVKILADRFIFKDYVQKDTEKIIRLFEKAAGLPGDGAYFAMWLGWLYDKGEQIPKDTKKAFNWYRKGATGGNDYAQYRLGVLMLDKDGPKYAPEEAVENLEKSAKQSNISAIQFLADRYLYGDYEEIPQNAVKAIALYEQGVELGNADFADWLSRLYSNGSYGIEKNEEQADYWAKEAARIREQNAAE